MVLVDLAEVSGNFGDAFLPTSAGCPPPLTSVAKRTLLPAMAIHDYQAHAEA